MKAHINEVELQFASIEKDHLRTAAAHSDAEVPFDNFPTFYTTKQVRQVRRVIESALNNDSEERGKGNQLLDTGERTELLRIRKQLKQVEEGIEKAENVF